MYSSLLFLPSFQHFVIFLSNRNYKTSHMKHFKLNIKHITILVADLCITGIPTKDYISVVKDFNSFLNDNHIYFDYIVKEDQMLVAKREEVSWSISE